MASKITPELDMFLSNMTDISMTRTKRGVSRLTPVSEIAPTMWAVTHAWPSFSGTHVLLKGGQARPSDSADTNIKKIIAARSSLVTLMMVIAATTPELGVSEAIPTKTTRAWCTFIATMARVIFTQPLEKTNVGAVEKSISDDLAVELVDYTDELRAYSGSKPGCLDSVEITKKAVNIAAYLGLPEPGTVSTKIAKLILRRDADKEEPSYYALVVYMAGRALTTQADVAVQTARPKNLQAKFNEGATWGTIGGDARMTKGAYTHIAKAWLMNTTMRIGLLVPLISLETGEAYITGNIIYTMFKLLRGAGMAHVGIIFEFLRRHPWVAEMESLSGEMYLLALHSVSLNKSEADLRPFFKVLYADSTNYFDSKALSRLTGLAVTVLARTNKTLENYVHIADASLLTEFDDAVKAHNANLMGA